MDRTGPTQKVNRTLQYNPNWSERVFSSKATTEELLAPEREAGNLTTHDYETALTFHQGYHRYYPLIFLVTGSALALTIRKPQWSRFQRAGVVASFGVAGYALGTGSRIIAHSEFIRSIENPDGYRQAMENIKGRVGFPDDGPVLELAYEPSSEELSRTTTANGSSLSIVLPTSSDSSQPATNLPSQKPPSKWDQIRMANNRGANNSTWDVLRQKHERESLKSQSNIHDEVKSWDGGPKEKTDTDQFADDGDKYLDRSK